jgi:nitrate/nitrite transport system substrate-binding protein
MQRRDFLKWAGAAAVAPVAANVLAACGDSKKSDTAASSGASTSATPTTAFSGTPAKVRLGFIALTDAAPVIMAKELGFFAARGVDASVEKQASWPALRDALLNGQLDAAHCLGSMPFSVATSIGGAGSRDLKVAMYLNQNGQAITLAKEFESVGYGDVKAAGALLNSKDAPALAMTFPGGTHDLWLRYWVKASGADATKLKISPVPPPQMVQNMTVDAIQGYCVGEPWNAVAVQKDIGFTHLATQDLWENHPEKALVTTGKFATEQRDVLKRVMGAVLEAAKWLDEPVNRSKAADTLGVEQYVNAPPDDIRGRLTGKYDLGGGLGTKDFAGKQMQFFRDGEVSAPRRSYGIWYLAQYQRLGLLPSAPAYKELADALILSDLYAEVAKEEGITVPSDDMSPFTVKLDGAIFDPANPGAEAVRA